MIGSLASKLARAVTEVSARQKDSSKEYRDMNAILVIRTRIVMFVTVRAHHKSDTHNQNRGTAFYEFLWFGDHYQV